MFKFIKKPAQKKIKEKDPLLPSEEGVKLNLNNTLGSNSKIPLVETLTKGNNPLIRSSQIKFSENIDFNISLFKERLSTEYLKKLCANVITKQVESALHKSQKELGVDYLGFGSVLHSYYPQLYERLNWEKFFPGIQVKINVKASINRFGLTK